MKKGVNGIHPAAAVLLTLAAAVLTVILFKNGRSFWGVVLALITVDFCADALLSFRKGTVKQK